MKKIICALIKNRKSVRNFWPGKCLPTQKCVSNLFVYLTGALMGDPILSPGSNSPQSNAVSAAGRERVNPISLWSADKSSDTRRLVGFEPGRVPARNR